MSEDGADRYIREHHPHLISTLDEMKKKELTERWQEYVKQHPGELLILDDGISVEKAPSPYKTAAYIAAALLALAAGAILWGWAIGFTFN